MYKYDKIEIILVLNRFSILNIRILLSLSTIVYLIVGIETSGLGARSFTVVDWLVSWQVTIHCVLKFENGLRWR